MNDVEVMRHILRLHCKVAFIDDYVALNILFNNHLRGVIVIITCTREMFVHVQGNIFHNILINVVMHAFIWTKRIKLHLASRYTSC